MASQADSQAGKLFGVLAEFDSASQLYYACEKVRDAGYNNWDSYTPFPVHNLYKAMGLKPTRVGWFCLGGGLTGAATGLLLQWWVSVKAYPLIIAGKPLFSWPAFIPVIFELMVLFAVLGAVLRMFHFTRLPRLHHPLFASERFEKVTDNKFFIAIEATDPNFDVDGSTELLREVGATHTELVNDDD